MRFDLPRTMKLLQHLFVLLAGTFLWPNVLGNTRPNIVLLLADDAGWRDFEGHDEMMRTPNILRLRSEGVFLNQSYVMPMCSPTRAALLTGRFSHTIGAQDGNIISENKLNWLNENLTLLPQELTELGYRTHMVGKWHLGCCHPGLTPEGRGFDSFYGFLLGKHDSYYTHMNGSHPSSAAEAYDWWDGNEIDWSAQGHYQTDLLNRRAVKIINESDSSTPFFLYQSWGAPHGPFQCPQSYQETYCSHITDSDRKIDCCMMAVLDKGVGDIVQALKDKGIYNNTIILFMSDNGGPSKNGSSNWPLRGSKKSVYEGGIRSYTILKAAGLQDSGGSVWSGMTHVVDWLPTLLGLAGGSRPTYAHGFNLWPAIQQGSESPRDRFLLINDYWRFNHTLFRYKNWKLLQMSPGLKTSSRWSPGFKPGWYPPYHLINNGSAQTVTMKNQKLKSTVYQLYNLEEDPYEENDLGENPTNQTLQILHVLQDELQKELKRYPLLPFPAHFHYVSNFTKDGALTTDWCQPAGLVAATSDSSSGKWSQFRASVGCVFNLCFVLLVLRLDLVYFW